MTTGDVEASRVVQAFAFAGPDDPTDPSTFPPEVTARQHRRINQFLTHDAPGSWVAESDDGVIGVALALRRDDLWGCRYSPFGRTVRRRAWDSGCSRQRSPTPPTRTGR